MDTEARTVCPPSHRPSARFVIRAGAGAEIVCLRHAVFHRRVLRMSIPTAAVVGTILTAINQGTVLADGQLPAVLAWKIPLTYSVPFCVSTWGALRVARVKTPGA
jgi:hypothetical protein